VHQLGGITRHTWHIVWVATEVASEKNIAYPTDTKLAIKIINRLNKLAKRHDIKAQNLG
jgi:hypothetical protein